MRAPPLPERLAYLIPVRRRLAALPAEELNEDIDPTLFSDALSERVSGLSPEEAKNKLRGDVEELQEWLGQHTVTERLHFALGFLIMASESPQKMLAAISERHTEGQISMQFPETAKTKRHFQGWKIRWSGFTVWVVPCDETSFRSETEGFQEPVGQYAHLIAVAVSPVRLGAVQGAKRVETTAELGAKHVKYALEVPGGHATAAVMKKGLKWEESQVENWLSTIQVTTSHEPIA